METTAMISCSPVAGCTPEKNGDPRISPRAGGQSILWNHFNSWGHFSWIISKILLLHGDMISWGARFIFIKHVILIHNIFLTKLWDANLWARVTYEICEH